MVNKQPNNRAYLLYTSQPTTIRKNKQKPTTKYDPGASQVLQNRQPSRLKNTFWSSTGKQLFLAWIEIYVFRCLSKIDEALLWFAILIFYCGCERCEHCCVEHGNRQCQKVCQWIFLGLLFAWVHLLVSVPRQRVYHKQIMSKTNWRQNRGWLYFMYPNRSLMILAR